MQKVKQHKFKIGDKVKILPRKEGQRDQYPTYTDTMIEDAGKQARIEGINEDNTLGLDIDKNYEWHPDWLELIDDKIKTAIAKKLKNLNNIQSCKMLKKLQKHYN